MLCLGTASLAYGVELNAAQVSINDTVQFGAHRVFAGFEYDHVNGKWNDGWTLSLKRDAFLGTAGFISDFKYISLGVTASSAPAITSELTIHTADSSLYAGTLFGSGNPTLATIRWESENENDEVHEIEADWESAYIYKGLVVGRKKGRYQARASFEQFRTTPVKQDEEYFIKDSSHIIIWDVHYRYSFDNSALDLQYMSYSAQSNIIGNSYRDGSTKRFMYLPVKGFIHYGNVHWGNESYGLDAKGIAGYGKLEKNNERFYETLAPNRILPASVAQVLSFSFLQRNYLVDADLDIAAATFGGYFNPHFDIFHNMQVVPKFGLYGYYTYDELEIERTSKTTSFIGFNADTEWWLMSLESTGLIANVGIALDKAFRDNSFGISLEWSAAQIIPLKTDIREKTDFRDSDNSTTKKPEGASPSGIFKNGFATQLVTTLRF